MKKYLFLGLVLLAFSNVQAQVQRLQKPLSKKTIQALPETFVVLDTVTYNQLIRQSEELKKQKAITEYLNEEIIKNMKISKLNAELATKLSEDKNKQMELMQQEIESLKKQLAEKNKKN